MHNDRTHSWKSLVSWVLCGALWGLAWFGIFTIGVFALPFALVLTILLLKDGIPGRSLRIVWIAFGLWLVLWALVIFQVVVSIGFVLLLASLAFLVEMRHAGPAGWGLLAGVGLWPIWLAIRGVDPPAGWLGTGIAMIGVALTLFYLRSRSSQVEGAHTTG